MSTSSEGLRVVAGIPTASIITVTATGGIIGTGGNGIKADSPVVAGELVRDPGAEAA